MHPRTQPSPSQRSLQARAVPGANRYSYFDLRLATSALAPRSAPKAFEVGQSFLDFLQRPGFSVIVDAYDDTTIQSATREGNRLMSQVPGQAKYELLPEATDKFFFADFEAEITFVRDETGKVTQLILHQRGDHPAKKVK